MWRVNYFRVPLVLINKMEARKHWRVGMTGNEALLMQRFRLLKNSYSS